jgi:linoleoyl-CoA desaturase
MKAKFFQNPEAEKAFYKSLRERVHQSLKGKTISYGNVQFWTKGLFWIAVSYGAYVWLLTQMLSPLWFWVFYLVFQLSGLLIGFSIGHDASHHTAFKSKRANAIVHFLSFFTFGIDPLLWGLRHIRSHHLYANVEGSDIDMDKNPFLRLSPTHPQKPKHKYQAYYAPFVYMLALLHSVFVGDWVYLFSKEYEWMREGVKRWELYVRFFGFKIIYFAIVLVLPLAFSHVPWYSVVIAYISTSAFTSLIFVVMLVGTHFFAEAEYPQPEGEHLEHNWAVHQLTTSCDWNANDPLARFLSGGANCHAAHHLFPYICHTHYGDINPIIEQAAKEHRIPYHHKTLWAMMESHFRHLNAMGKPAPIKVSSYTPFLPAWTRKKKRL